MLSEDGYRKSGRIDHDKISLRETLGKTSHERLCPPRNRCDELGSSHYAILDRVDKSIALQVREVCGRGQWQQR